MTFSFNTYKKISNLFENNDILWASEISDISLFSRATVHKVLNKLLKERKIKKVWKASHTRYQSLIFKWKKEGIDNFKEYLVDFKTKKFFDQNFYKYDSDWKLLVWFKWFIYCLQDRNFDFKKSIESYKKIFNYIDWLEDKCWLLESSTIFDKKFEKTYMTKVFYWWEYSFMEFGRSKLAEMTFYAKQSQNKKLINESIDEIFYKLECLIKTEKINAIAITPWSIDRRNQLLWILKLRLAGFNIPFINIIKSYESNISIPQKSIKSREWRIKNATNTIFVYDENVKSYSKILLIDDFVWSWATLNITAKKITEAWWKNVIWFSFVWSMDLSYEVINEI